jgi:hypothetical protein
LDKACSASYFQTATISYFIPNPKRVSPLPLGEGRVRENCISYFFLFFFPAEKEAKTPPPTKRRVGGRVP